eukprot:415299-Amphidinium_carterae.1
MTTASGFQEERTTTLLPNGTKKRTMKVLVSFFQQDVQISKFGLFSTVGVFSGVCVRVCLFLGNTKMQYDKRRKAA